jgi:hypothetical protein
VAALFAAAILRRNPDSVVIPFDTSAYDAKIDPNDSILSISEGLAKYGGGGTDCSLPLGAANKKHAKRKFADIVLVSDNESWVGTGRHGSTGVMTAWEAFVANQRSFHQPQSFSSRLVANPRLIRAGGATHPLRWVCFPELSTCHGLRKMGGELLSRRSAGVRAFKTPDVVAIRSRRPPVA